VVAADYKQAIRVSTGAQENKGARCRSSYPLVKFLSEALLADTSMFTTNDMLSWWTFDSIPLPAVIWRLLFWRLLKAEGCYQLKAVIFVYCIALLIKAKVLKGDQSGVLKRRVTSMIQNWQANWTSIAVTSLFFSKNDWREENC